MCFVVAMFMLNKHLKTFESMMKHNILSKRLTPDGISITKGGLFVIILSGPSATCHSSEQAQ